MADLRICQNSHTKMTKTEEVLSYLITHGLNNEIDSGSISSRFLSLSKGLTVDEWMRLFDLSEEQGVAAICVDGMQRLAQDSGSGFQVPSDAALEYRKFQFFGGAMQIEQTYQQQWKAIEGLTRLYADNGIKTIVLKGVAIAQYYPKANHRQCGDLDCVMVKDGVFDLGKGYECANELIEAQGIAIDKDFYKEAKFAFPSAGFDKLTNQSLGTSLTIENHRFCTAVRGSKRAKGFERLLQGLLQSEELTKIEGLEAWCPGPMFNALFLTHHALNHFLSEGLTLRHVCDWAMLLRFAQSLEQFGTVRNDSEEFWNQWKSTCKEYGMLRFGLSMMYLAEKVCGVKSPVEIPDEIPPLAERLLGAILDHSDVEHMTGSLWNQRKVILRNMWKSRWKYDSFYDQSQWQHIMRLAMGYLFDKEPKV